MNRNLKDIYRLYTYLTLQKIGNIYKNWQTFKKAKKNKLGIQSALPISMAIEPTTSCNLRCPECPSGLRSFTRPTGMLDPALYQPIIDEMAPYLWYLTLYFQGEPYLNPHFLDLVKYAHDRGIYTATSTNGHYLSDENVDRTIDSGLDRLIISLDGVTQETYSSYRKGGSLEKVLEGIRCMVTAKKVRKKGPHIIIQFLVVKPNEHEIGAAKALAAELQVDEIAFKTAQIYDYEWGSPLIPTRDKYARYKKGKEGKWTIKAKWENHCWKMWQSAVITWDGKVVPCCFDKDAVFEMGQVGKEQNKISNSFSSIWKSDAYMAFRKRLLSDRSSIGMCKNCTEGLKIWT